jgi:hypothetical protein
VLTKECQMYRYDPSSEDRVILTCSIGFTGEFKGADRWPAQLIRSAVYGSLAFYVTYWLFVR